MWLLFIVVVLVISVLMVFLILAIRMLTRQAKEQLNRYFLKNLETYDRLAENKNAEIDELQGQVDELQGRLDNMNARLAAMAAADESRPAPAGSGGLIETASSASVRDAGFLEDYAYVRQHMKLDYRARIQELLDRIEDEDGEDQTLLLCRRILEKLPTDRLYDIIVMQETEQIEYLKALLDAEEDAFLLDYAEETGSFDLLAFQNYLTDYVRGHEQEVYIRTGNPEELKGLEDAHVHVLYDEGVHEGVRVSYKNTVYDFSL